MKFKLACISFLQKYFCNTDYKHLTNLFCNTHNASCNQLLFLPLIVSFSASSPELNTRLKHVICVTSQKASAHMTLGHVISLKPLANSTTAMAIEMSICYLDLLVFMNTYSTIMSLQVLQSKRLFWNRLYWVKALIEIAITNNFSA